MSRSRKDPQLYTIKELENAARLPRRTIHYYVQEGLLAPPTGRGRHARYDVDHLVRLRLIERAKGTMRLDAIRDLMADRPTHELQTIVDQLDAGTEPYQTRVLDEQSAALRADTPWDPIDGATGAPPVSPRDHSQDLDAEFEALYDAEREERRAMRPSGQVRRPTSTWPEQTDVEDGMERYLSSSFGMPESAAGEEGDEPILAAGEETGPAGEPWQRVKIHDDVEIHFRSSRSPGFDRVVQQLIRFARHLFGRR